MRQNILVLIGAIVFGSLIGQEQKTIYKGLEKKKFYSVELSSQTKNGVEYFQVNGREVNKSTYKKFELIQKNIENCCPCILEFYDENENLIREAVSCKDCGVGQFKEYSSDGKVKIIGQYKENQNKNWKNLWERGLCSIPDGKWTYFNTSGDTLYYEVWNNGSFLKQVPEQNQTEIWKIELTRKGEIIENQTLTLEQVNELIIIPKFKNSNRELANLTINFEVSAIGHKQSKKSFSLDNFKNIDVNDMLTELGITSEEKATFKLKVFNNGIMIASFYLNVEH
jgi:hypothetical protein